MAKYKNICLDRVLTVVKSLADENRLRVFVVLQKGELCVCQLTELLGLAPSTVSKHISILKQAGLVKARKDGRWIYYSITHELMDGGIKSMVRGLFKNLKNDVKIREDKRLLSRILKMNPGELCRKQCRR